MILLSGVYELFGAYCCRDEKDREEVFKVVKNWVEKDGRFVVDCIRNHYEIPPDQLDKEMFDMVCKTYEKEWDEVMLKLKP